MLCGDLGISNVQAFFPTDMFELFLMAVHNGNINLSGCAITKTGMLYSPLGDRREQWHITGRPAVVIKNWYGIYDQSLNMRWYWSDLNTARMAQKRTEPWQEGGNEPRRGL